MRTLLNISDRVFLRIFPPLIIFAKKLQSRYLAGSQMRVCFLFMNWKWEYEYSSPCILHWHHIRKYNDFIKFFLYVSILNYLSMIRLRELFW